MRDANSPSHRQPRAHLISKLDLLMSCKEIEHTRLWMAFKRVLE